MSPKSTFNPFPGLRPFGIEEDYLFFGREEQVAELLGLLRKHRFLAVVGTSGSGKSSLVRAGLLPALHGGTLTQAGSSWEVLLLRPGGDPITNLARNLLEADLYDSEDGESLPRVKATLTRSRMGLAEAAKQSDLPADTNLLVVVDQFEELFRYRDTGVSGQEGAAAFVKLLLSATQQQERPIYVAITMRSDYLGDCAQIPGLAEAVNDGEYLIPRLSRKQRRAAIEKPVHVGGGAIAGPLVHKLLNEVGDDTDQLPVLQHALMRIWDHWTAEDNADQPIGLTHYHQVGGLQEALSIHADEVYAQLPSDRHRLLAQKLFQTITERGPDNRGIRRPTCFDHLCEIVDGDSEEVGLVIDAFRRGGRTFLMPPQDVELGPETVVDISHESLMRVWRQLRDWVEEESQSARIYRRLADTAGLYEEGKAGLYHDPDLQIASSWRQTTQPSEPWARRYHQDFAQAMAFLDASWDAGIAAENEREATRQREIQHARKLAEAQRQRAETVSQAARRLRGMVGGLALVASLAVVSSFVAFNYWRTAESAKEAALLSENVAKLSEDSAKLSEASAKHSADVARKEATRATASEGVAVAAQTALRQKKYSSDMTLAQHAYNDGNLDAVAAQLLEHLPGPGEPDTRGIEWFLWWNASHQESAVSRVDAHVFAVAVSPNGRLAADSYWRNNLRLRETAGPQRIKSLVVENAGDLHALCFSPDSSMLAAVSYNSVFRFRTEDGTSLGSAQAPVRLRDLSFSEAQDAMVSGGNDGRLYLWDTVSWTRSDFLASNESLPIWSVAYSPDGGHIAVGTDGGRNGGYAVVGADSPLVLWDTSANAIQKTSAGHTARISSVAWSPDGEYLASGSADETVRVWTKELSPVKTLNSLAWVSEVAFSPDGKYLAAGTGKDNAIRVWSTGTWELVTTIKGHSKPVTSIAFDPRRGDLWSGSMDATIKTWDVERLNGQPVTVVQDESLRNMLKDAYETVVASDGQTLFCAGLNGLIERYDLASRTAMPAWNGGQHFRRVALSDDGDVMTAVSQDGQLQVWRTDSEDPIAESQMPLEDLSSLHTLGVSRGATIVAWAAGTPLHLVVVDMNSGNRRQTPVGINAAENWKFMTISPDAKQMSLKSGFNFGLAGIDDSLPQESARSGVRSFPGAHLANSFVFSSDGNVGAAPAFDSLIYLRDLQSDQGMKTLKGHSSEVHHADFSQDGRRLLSGSEDGTVRIWDVETGDSLTTLRGHRGPVNWVGFAKVESEIISISRADGTVRIWHAATREELRQDPFYWTELAEHHKQAGELGEATAAYDEAIRLSPQNVDLLLARAGVDIGKEVTAADCIRVISLGGANSQLVDRARRMTGSAPLVANSSGRTVSWQYSFEQPSEQWKQLDFDEAAWKVGVSPFGSFASNPTRWVSADIWLRYEFELDAPVSDSLFFNVYCDDVADIFLNGVHAATGQWVGTETQLIPCAAEAAAALKAGRNVLAVHCHNTHGDAGISAELFVDDGALPWIDLLNDALDNDPANVHLLRARFLAHSQQRNVELAAIDAATVRQVLREAVDAELQNADVVWPKSADLLTDVLLVAFSAENPNDLVADRLRALPGGWDRLAAVYDLLGDTQSLGRLLEYKPRAAIGIGDWHVAAENWDQAIATYSRFISSDTRDASVLVKRGDAYAGSGQWKNAEADWRRAVDLFPGILQEPFDRHRLAGNWQPAANIGVLLTERDPANRTPWLQTAPMFVLADDEQGYRDFCRRMIKQFGETTDFRDAETTCKACLLTPGAVDISQLPVRAFTESLDQGTAPAWIHPWLWASRALVAYRSDDIAELGRCFQEGWKSQPNPTALALTYSLAALDRHRRGDFDGAHEALGHANRLIKEQMPGANASQLHDWLIPQILAREAEKLLDAEESLGTNFTRNRLLCFVDGFPLRYLPG